MTVWTVASTLVLATIFYLNALITATPYIQYLSGVEKPAIRKTDTITALLLLLAAIAYFCLRVGSFAGEGISGMADLDFMKFIWVSPAGEFVKLQILASALWLVYSMFSSLHIKRIIYVLVVVAISWSFLSMGHGKDAVWWGKIALLTHLLVAWVWFGSLNSLRKLATSVPVTKAQAIMMRFGVHMLMAVPLLLIAGGIMYRSATGQWIPKSPLTTYDFVLFTKLGFVILILFMAALHKFKFVPKLNNKNSAKRLKKSIAIEMILAIVILVLALALSSSFSPN
ncbi:copper resistance D family protein [Pseudidiomarina sp. E22-M8]|uniref:copper resistance D family protein n=1 Tax=Pseudidiomarina sp. E22-M8 TaxID=3424768 RepID=UPI00403D19D4